MSAECYARKYPLSITTAHYRSLTTACIMKLLQVLLLYVITMYREAREVKYYLKSDGIATKNRHRTRMESEGNNIYHTKCG